METYELYQENYVSPVIYLIGIVLWLAASLVAGLAASQKGNSFWDTLLISILLSPILGFLYAIALPDKKARTLFGSILDTLTRADIQVDQEG